MRIIKVLNVKNFSKSYGEKEVIHDISFSINQKDMFAILGVNGAGKTTLLESIEGLRPFNKGSVEFVNNELFGVQLQSSTLPENIKVSEIIKLLCVWNKNKNYDKYIKLFDLENIKNQIYKTLSTGQKRKLHLVLALINESDVLFLDEPTAGLDVEARAEFHGLLRELNREGKTIIFSSHDMGEVESLCNQMIFLKDGKIRFSGSIEEFKRSVKRSFKVSIKTIESDEYENYELEDLTNELFNLISKYKEKGMQIDDLKILQPSLEEVFLTFAEEEN